LIGYGFIVEVSAASVFTADCHSLLPEEEGSRFFRNNVSNLPNFMASF
jgi:hypothetical protein